MKLEEKIKDVRQKAEDIRNKEEWASRDHDRLNNYERRLVRLRALDRAVSTESQREFNAAILDYLFATERVE